MPGLLVAYQGNDMPIILRVKGYRFWFYEADLSLMWERGRDQEPVEFVDDRNILAKIG
jgi:hypothetical protein